MAKIIKILLVATIALIIAGTSAYFALRQENAPSQTIINFEQCADAGYPIGESYPRQCWTPDGKHFVEEIKKSRETDRQNSEKCGIENCHGLNITCGPNVPDACSMMYAAGDNCRQFASCQIINDRCNLEKSQKFDSCKACVKKCEQDFLSDQIKFFECESKCAE